MFSLAGRTAFVTGAAQGLGLSIAQALAEAGARVVLADLDERADAPAAAMRAAGHDALALPLDVRDETAFKAAFAEAVRKYGAVDIMVNNAARTPMQSVWDIDATDWDDVLAVNLRGAFFGCRIAGLHLRQRAHESSTGTGRIINIASIAGQQASAATGAHYAASKAGVLALTRSFAQVLAPTGATVNAIAPAAVESPALEGIDAPARAALKASIPLGRFGEGREVGAAVVYLASDAAAFTTGAVIDVNGGRLMR